MEFRTLLLYMSDGSAQRFVIPTAAKVTLGNFAPGARNSGDNSRTLRVYLNKEQQIAVIPGVQKFFSLDDTTMSTLHIDNNGDPIWKESDGSELIAKAGMKALTGDDYIDDNQVDYDNFGNKPRWQ